MIWAMLHDILRNISRPWMSRLREVRADADAGRPGRGDDDMTALTRFGRLGTLRGGRK